MAHPGGRPSKYKKEYCEMIIDYFTVQPQQTVYKKTYFADGTLKSEEPIVLPEQLPTFQKFADSVGVTVSTLWEWEKEYDEFSKAYARAKQLQEHVWLVNGMGNLYNAQFAQFFGKNCLGYKDKTDVELTGKNGGPIEMTLEDADRIIQEYEGKLSKPD
jgi:hypothetical protein